MSTPIQSRINAKRNKRSWSCVECRKRKKLCDRQVPNCSQCVTRGTEFLCKWGDERDHAPHGIAPDGSIPALSSRVAGSLPRGPQDEDSLIHELGRGELAEAQPSFAVGRPPLTALTFAQAKLLLEHQLENDIFVRLVNYELVGGACDRGHAEALRDMQSTQPDIYALTLGLCTAALTSMPHSYAITLGIVEDADGLDRLINELDAEAQQTMSLIRKPTFELIQARHLHAMNYGHRALDKNAVGTLDSTIRAARYLGLDRLGTPQDDEQRWRIEDREKLGGSRSGMTGANGSPALTSASGDPLWSAKTFRARDCKARNLGRLHWALLRTKDWTHAPWHGSHSIDPRSYTTGLPQSYSDGWTDGQFPTTQAEMIHYVDFSAEALRRFAEICGRAESYGEVIDYDAILQLDAELLQSLSTVPESMRMDEPAQLQNRTRQERTTAIIVTATLWHRLFIIHRPFILLSRTEPEQYGVSASRTWHYAMRTIQAFRQEDSMITSSMPWVFRMIQAALVLISHLFFRSDLLCKKEIMQVHDQVQFVISSCKRVGRQQGTFAIQGQKLEGILAAAARMRRSKDSLTSQSTPTAEASWAESNQSADPVAAVGSTVNDVALDESLIRLVYGCDAQGSVGAPSASNDELWSELFERLGERIAS